MNKLYLSAPLPFMGQKRMYAKEFIKVIKEYPAGTTFVDLFGGSGLLSHITKHFHPQSHVVYNDFDNYRHRILNIPRTNMLLHQLRDLTSGLQRHKMIPAELKTKIISVFENELAETGYLDLITLSSSILFSMKYRTTIDELKKETLYNNIRKSDYQPCPGYLDGLEITSCDYKELFNRYKDKPDTVFIIDPPYLSTEVGPYSGYWTLSDYLDVLNLLSGHNYIYFTSDKSSIIELCQWMGRNPFLGNPFDGAREFRMKRHVNFNAGYTDIMLYKSL